ncbi:hypothetical protein [Nocardioides stalactiti]|uniref:hypothetical protein n=1 Tax=Nocardioides stalactiti TaxID=2755356 RepID=UPI001601E984|nr:hypothetical protein [Nocardioides stalactiti]
MLRQAEASAAAMMPEIEAKAAAAMPESEAGAERLHAEMLRDLAREVDFLQTEPEFPKPDDTMVELGPNGARRGCPHASGQARSRSIAVRVDPRLKSVR